MVNVSDSPQLRMILALRRLGSALSMSNRAVGSALGIFAADEPNDGTVAVSETELPQAAAFYHLHTSHSALQFDRQAATLADRWFRGEALE